MAMMCAAACNDPTGPSLPRDTEALFQTDSLAYTLSAEQLWWEGRVTYAFTNNTGKPVSFVNCNGQTRLVFQKLEGAAWRDIWGPATFECLSAPITVAPGETQVSSVRVLVEYPGGPGDPGTSASDLTGTFRIVWESAVHDYATGTTNFGTVLPIEQRISNRFLLRVENR
jgi:hypothetical protein